MLGQAIRGTEGRDVLRSIGPKWPFVPPIPNEGIGDQRAEAFKGIHRTL